MPILIYKQMTTKKAKRNTFGTMMFSKTPTDTPMMISGNAKTARFWSTNRPLPFFNGCGCPENTKNLNTEPTNVLALLKAIAFFASKRMKPIVIGMTRPAPDTPPRLE